MDSAASDFYVDRVRELHLLIGYPHESAPSMGSVEQRALWARLIAEECRELLSAIDSANLEGTADGIADVMDVVLGAALTFGLPVAELFNEVHSSNMSKTTGGVVWREDGKLLRGENYSPPDIRKVLGEVLRDEGHRS